MDGMDGAAGEALAQAEAICERRGTRLTDLRRQVLGLILRGGRPLGAYELLEQLRPCHPGAAPPTVYRALDFLLQNGLIHKVERLSAFVGCVHGGDEHHAVQFLVCSRCGRAAELNDPGVARALVAAAAGVGFRVGASTIEAAGVCSGCCKEGK